MALTKVALSGTYLDGEGRPLAGTLKFAMSTTLTSTADDDILRPVPIAVPLDGTGSFTVSLYSTDNASLAPSGWKWRVLESITGLPNRQWSFDLLHATGATQNIADLAVLEAVPSYSTYLPLAGGTMSGTLILAGDPTSNLHAATKRYVDAHTGGGGATAVADWLNATDTAYAGGAAGDGATDCTAALTAWITALNAAAPGVSGYLPAGVYLVSTALPAITANGITIAGDGWAQGTQSPAFASNAGSVIKATASAASPVLTLSGETITVQALTVDMGSDAPVGISVPGFGAVLSNMQVRAAPVNGIGIDVLSGGASVWIDGAVTSLNAAGSTGIRINDTDAIITRSKPKNSTYNIQLLTGAHGALIEGNHMTPGLSQGRNCVWINGFPSQVVIAGNRFDNYVRSAIQVSPGNTAALGLHIDGNRFFSSIMASGYALIGVDTSHSPDACPLGMSVTGNSGYASTGGGGVIPAYVLAAHDKDGTGTTAGRIASNGCLFTGNSFYVATAMYGPGAAPTTAGLNMITLDGAAWTAVADQAVTASPQNARYRGVTGQAPRESIPFYATPSNVTPSTGVMLLSVIPVVPGDQISTLGFQVGGTGATLGGSPHWWTVLYDAAGVNLIGQSADQSGALAGGTAHSLALVAASGFTIPYVVPPGVFALLGGAMFSMTTPPQLRGVTLNTATVDSSTSLVPTALMYAATAGSSLTTTAAAAPLTLAVSGGIPYLVAN